MAQILYTMYLLDELTEKGLAVAPGTRGHVPSD